MIILYRCLLLAVAGLALEPSSDSNCTDVRINNGPLITPCVSEIILKKGQNVTLTCKGSSNLQFRQQDVAEEVTSNFTIVNTSKSISEEGFSFQRTLELYNVDQYAIGFYACSDDDVDENIVNSITEEPDNTEHVSYIYVYVEGTESLFAPMRELIMSRSNKILIECRPTTPDVQVSLLPPKSQNKTPKYSPKIGYVLKKCGSFSLTCYGQRGNFTDKKRIRISVTAPPKPVVSFADDRFVKGETFNLTCTINITRNTIAKLSWNLPGMLKVDGISIIEATYAGNVSEGEIYNILTVINATNIHEGDYSCVSKNGPCAHEESNKVYKKYLDNIFINGEILSKPGITRQPTASINLRLDGYPPVNNITILKNGKLLSLLDKDKYETSFVNDTKKFNLRISSLNVKDTAKYTFIASNGKLENITHYKLEVAAKTENFFSESDQKCEMGKRVTFRCDVSGYPLPNVSWNFFTGVDNYTLERSNEKETTIYNKTSFLDHTCNKSGNITCLASDRKRKVPKTRQLLIYEIANGFGISSNEHDNEQKWVLENDQVSVRCLASKYDFENVTWEIDNNDNMTITVKYLDPTEFSYVAELEINGATQNHNGSYKCIAIKKDGGVLDAHIHINVLELMPPVIMDHVDSDEEVFRYMDMSLNCTVTGAPLPKIKWFKDGEPLTKNFSNVEIYENQLDRTTVIGTIKIEKMQPENVGKYECEAEGRDIKQKKYFALKLKVDKEPNKIVTNYLIAIAVIILILIVLIVYLTVKIRKEKQFRRELAAAGLLYFKEGVINSLNPDLGIDEQAELLPYDEKFEFPPEKLIYGKQLGAGAFGVVYKAEARGIINAEESTPVAVKMVKKTADNMYIKALASELKIMVHLGKHINIVNLLGACTKNVGKRELVVIVEYCKYGNIHNYMQRHREVFIDQLDTDNKEKLGKVNRAYTTTSSGSSGVPSDYFGSANTQDTDNTFLNTANTVHSARKNIPSTQPTEEVKASEGYVQPEWRSNYESDYSYDGRSPRPLSSRDLLAWAFQIARGMEYLASRKVLHGDLAARNILLADDNIVKICDFGLAKSIYKNDEYQKKENCPLPVKWLAIECMTDRIFSTQSDVWSFGIVLWELFTLAKTPYPNIHPASLLEFLSEGHRLDKPPYADDRIYGVMKKCWEAKPTLRPTFSLLQELLGTFLEDNVRNHYVDLNSGYIDNNAKVGGQEDYLDMVCAPDYNNMVTPSPHHYVNTDKKSFFPPSPVKVDEEGYLQMSPSIQGIFSPRGKESEFDFDQRKFNSKSSEAGSCGSELTPMLTLNNLPARSGSESDHEGNAPYLNVCTRIDEEADEVFAPSFNDTKNAKNIQSAVTNPTYITFDHIDEKPKDIINSYVNINVPNGLVK